MPEEDKKPKPKIDRESIFSYRRPMSEKRYTEAMNIGSPIGGSQPNPLRFICEVCHNSFPDDPGKTKFSFRGANVCKDCFERLKKSEESRRFDDVLSGKKYRPPTGGGDETSGGGETASGNGVGGGTGGTGGGGETPIKCPDCGEEFSSRQELYYHRQIGCTLKGKLKGELKKQTVGRAAEAGVSAANTFADGIKFTIATTLLFFITLNNFIPTVQGWIGLQVIDTSAAYYSFVFRNAWALTLICTVISFVLAFMLGWIGQVSLKGFYQTEAIIVTMEVLVLLANSLFIPWICGANPEICKSVSCIAAWMKEGYGLEDAQKKCSGEEELEVTKEDQKWETLDLRVGLLETPTAGDEFTFKFSLINRNSEGSKYIINVTDVSVSVSATPDFSSPTPVQEPDPPMPPYSILPAGTDCDTCGEPVEFTFKKLPDCDEDQFYFRTKVITEQAGGGSGDIKLVDKASGEFFEPKITTNPGPVDIYVYTYPYLLDFDKLNDPKIPSSQRFKFWIAIKNKCGKLENPGKMTLSKLTVVYPTSDIPIKIQCPGYTTNPCKEQIEGKECFEIDKNIVIECDQYSGEEVLKEIKCFGTFTVSTFKGEKTSQASVSADYTYEQTFTTPPLGANCKKTEK